MERAIELIEELGEGAELEACQRADRAIEEGDPAGERQWLDAFWGNPAYSSRGFWPAKLAEHKASAQANRRFLWFPQP